ncbi:MAG: CorA family divalent cation transporter [Eubacteriales bacterium]|nr:CorA family divalent cation transporter [Eubacteriales bacterium]
MKLEIMTTKEYREKKEDSVQKRRLQESMERGKHCKAELFSDCIVGTFAIPDKTDLFHKKQILGYYLDQKELLLVSDQKMKSDLRKEVEKYSLDVMDTPAQFLAGFIEYLIKEDVIYLQNFEERLSKMEEHLIHKEMKRFDVQILNIRKELLILDSYYQQMIDLCGILEENRNNLMTEQECRVFGIQAARVERLHDSTHVLKEYSLQLRELYQSRMDERQNKVMQMLTVVTTIFMPLTLIAGWYGMNFTNMPELSSKYGYPIVIAVSVGMILLEILWFKWKKWF